MPPDATAFASDRFARFVSELDVSSVPTDVVASAHNRLADTVGVGLGGSSTMVLAKVMDAVNGLGGAGPATIWGSGATVGAGAAAMVNAAAVHAEDYDDTHTAGVVHGSACAVPAAWAAAEVADAHLDDLVRGVIAGWEVAARLGVASAGAFHRRGLHTTSVVGVFAAAAATAAVWHLDRPQTAAALGLAGSAAAGMNVYLLDGTSGKLLNPGFAAQAGLQAAALARSGVSGPGQVFEGRMGLFAALGEGVPDLGSVLDHLGQNWETERVSTKPYPACHFSHASIDAALELRRDGVTPESIESVVCRLPGPTWDLLCKPWEEKLDPRSEYAVKFSIPWLIALALTDGRVTRDSFEPGVLDRRGVRALANRVSVQEWTDSPFPETFPGSLRVRTNDGQQHSAECLVNRGHPTNPLGADEMRAKFLDCVSHRLSPTDGAEFFSALHDARSRVRDLGKFFQGRPSAADRQLIASLEKS